LVFPIHVRELSDVFQGRESGFLDPEYEIAGQYRKILEHLITIKIPVTEVFWSRGSLQHLDEFDTPGYVLAQKIAGSVPRQLISLLGFSDFDVFGKGFSTEVRSFNCHVDFRKHSPWHVSVQEYQERVKPIVLNAAEILTLSTSETYSYMILHLSCSNNMTNLNKLKDLNQLHNKPLKHLLDNFFGVSQSRHTDPYVGVQGFIPKDCRTGVLTTCTEDQIQDDAVDSGHLAIALAQHQKNLARFTARYSFIALLVCVQRDQLKKLVGLWPKIAKETLDQLIDARLALSAYTNQWWWPQVMLNGQTQSHYEMLQNSFGLQVQVEGLRAEIDDSWDVMLARISGERLKNSKRLTQIALGVATLGLAPLWVNIFESPKYGLSALAISGVVFGVIMFLTKTKKI
jgi:hypothetical protein